MARSVGAGTAAITGAARSKLAGHADHVLVTAGREFGFRSAAMASRTGQLLIIDALLVGVAQTLPGARTALHRTYSAVVDPAGTKPMSTDSRIEMNKDMTLAALGTETANDHTTDLDTMSVTDLLNVMNAEYPTVPVAVAVALPAIELAVGAIVSARSRGGRLVYLDAGTSGRLGVLDAVECPPTFGTDPGEVLGLIAGGERAFLKAVEGAEGDPDLAVTDLQAVGITAADVVVGIAASGRTPYVIGGLDYAARLGATTVSVACNTGAEISAHAGVAIEVDTGP